MEKGQQIFSLRIDHGSFTKLYRDHWKMVFGICFHMLKDADLAKEMAQDIFEAIWRRRDDLVIQGRPEVYLSKAAKLEVFEYIRNKHIREKHLDMYSESLPGYANSTQQEVYYQDLAGRVEKLLDHLPAKSKQVYQLRFYATAVRW